MKSLLPPSLTPQDEEKKKLNGVDGGTTDLQLYYANNNNNSNTALNSYDTIRKQLDTERQQKNKIILKPSSSSKRKGAELNQQFFTLSLLEYIVHLLNPKDTESARLQFRG